MPRNILKPKSNNNIELIDLYKLIKHLEEQHQFWIKNSEMIASEASDLIGDDRTRRTYWNNYHFSNGFERAYEELLTRFKHQYYELFYPDLNDL